MNNIRPLTRVSSIIVQFCFVIFLFTSFIIFFLFIQYSSDYLLPFALLFLSPIQPLWPLTAWHYQHSHLQTFTQYLPFSVIYYQLTHSITIHPYTYHTQILIYREKLFSYLCCCLDCLDLYTPFGLCLRLCGSRSVYLTNKYEVIGIRKKQWIVQPNHS